MHSVVVAETEKSLMPLIIIDFMTDTAKITNQFVDRNFL